MSPRALLLTIGFGLALVVTAMIGSVVSSSADVVTLAPGEQDAYFLGSHI